MADIVIPQQFILAARDAGYRSLGSAVAELLDNSIDAGASTVDVRIEEKWIDGLRQITVSVLDDGSGMDRRILSECLKFGGSERFNVRSSLGRYGMGLPSSSVSQAPRVDVYSWQKGSAPFRVYLDVEEIVTRRTNGVSEPVIGSLPDWVVSPSESGTLVQWSRCDRLHFKKASTVARKLTLVLGRIFRVPISSGLNLRVNDTAVAPVDPLFRVPIKGLDGTCEPYGDTLEYLFRTQSGGVSPVRVTFVELPVVKWRHLSVEAKRALGIVGGAGVSVLRAGREIDYGWHLFGNKRRENYDDWWRAELSFDPMVDEHVGITHRKQGVNPTTTMRQILEPDLERIARVLNRRARNAFNSLRTASPSTAVVQAARRDRILPPVKHGGLSIRRPTGRGFRFRIRIVSDPSSDFFQVSASGSLFEVCINQSHPFFRSVYSPAGDDSNRIEIMLLSAARALFDLPVEERQTFLRGWSDNLLAYLED